MFLKSSHPQTLKMVPSNPARHLLHHLNKELVTKSHPQGYSCGRLFLWPGLTSTSPRYDKSIYILDSSSVIVCTFQYIKVLDYARCLVLFSSREDTLCYWVRSCFCCFTQVYMYDAASAADELLPFIRLLLTLLDYGAIVFMIGQLGILAPFRGVPPLSCLGITLSCPGG